MIYLIVIILILSLALFIAVKLNIKKTAQNEILQKNLDRIELNMKKLKSSNIESTILESKKINLRNEIKKAKTDEEVKNAINNTLNLVNFL